MFLHLAFHGDHVEVVVVLEESFHRVLAQNIGQVVRGPDRIDQYPATRLVVMVEVGRHEETRSHHCPAHVVRFTRVTVERNGAEAAVVRRMQTHASDCFFAFAVPWTSSRDLQVHGSCHEVPKPRWHVAGHDMVVQHELDVAGIVEQDVFERSPVVLFPKLEHSTEWWTLASLESHKEPPSSGVRSDNVNTMDCFSCLSGQNTVR